MSAMNGPVSGAGEEEPVWERVWSLEEIRRSSHSWSLGADAGLLNCLKAFSHQLISRTHDIEKQLDGLVHEVKTSDCRLHNVFNDFLMLSNTQFIENRVYDEEVEEHIGKPDQGEKPEQEKTREQKEAELIPKIQEAVNYGLQVLETAFEQLDIKAGNSDSEEEEVNERIELILEPKDLYIDRPLPYLIGSQLFMQQEDVGLGDLSSEEGSVDNDRGSIIDSEEEEEEKDNEEDSEEDFGSNYEDEKKMPTALSDDDEDNGSDLFGASDKEDEEENERSAKTRTKSFADELAARIQAEIPKNQEIDQSSISSLGKTKKEKEKREAKPPSDDEEDDIFKPPKLTDEDFFGNKGGLFSGGRGLFDDDDDDDTADVEEGDLFTNIHTRERKPAEPPPVAKPEPLLADVKKKLPYGGVSLFPGGENVINSTILADKDKRKAAAPPEVAAKPAISVGLFDDDNDALFASPQAQPAAKPKAAADLFADDDDLFNDGSSILPATTDKNKASNSEKKNTQVPTDKPRPPDPSRKKLSKGLFSDEDDSESDLFSPSQSSSKPKAAATAVPPAKSKTGATLSLFDEDEDLFAAVPEKKPVVTAAAKPAQPPALSAAPNSPMSALFSSDEEEPLKGSNEMKAADKRKSVDIPPNTKKAEEPESKSSLFEEEDLFAITKDSQKKHNRVSLLFEEDQNGEEPLFSSKVDAAVSSGQTKKERAETTAPLKVGTERVSLFDEKPETSIHATPRTATPTLQKPNEVKPDLQESDADNLFAAIKSGKAKASNVLSLFEDEDDDDGGDRLPANAVQIDTAKVSSEKSTRVFQDEELLFSQELQRDNDPDVDLFASASKKSTGKNRTDKPSVASGLFGEDDDDDLFSAAKPKKPPKVQEKKTVIKKEPSEPLKERGGLKTVKPETALKTEGVEKPTEPAPIKAKSPSTRIEKLQANLLINPAALLPGAIPKLSAVRHGSPETAPSYSAAAGEGSRSSDTDRKEGVNFDTPVQVYTLHSANKSRVKVGGKRRPPSRMGRRLASQDSGENEDSNDSFLASPTQAASSGSAMAQSKWQSEREESVSSMKISRSENDVQSRTKPKAPVNPLTPDNDLFGSDLFGGLSGPVDSRQKIKSPMNEAIKEEGSKSASVFDADGSDDDLFKSIKDKPKKLQPASLLEDQPDDDDLFGVPKPHKKAEVQAVPPEDVKTTTNDIFEDDIFATEASKPVKKPKEKKPASEANLFDDNTDLFSDLAYKQKEKKPKKKLEAKSIFEDDMDDIFSTSVRNIKKSKPKAKSTLPMPETKQDTKAASAFDDPLNVLGK